MVTQNFKLASSIAQSGLLALTNKTKAKAFLTESLLSMTGLSGKLGQMLAMKLGAEGAKSHPPLPLTTVKELIRAADSNLYHQIDQVHPTGFPASIGQAHQVSLVNGKDVLVKIQRPGLKKAIKAELKLALKLLDFGPPKSFNMDKVAYCEFLTRELLLELDYNHEAKNQAKIQHDLKPILDVKVPAVIATYDTMLIEEFLPGATLEIAKTWNPHIKDKLSTALLSAFLRMTLVTGHLYADMNPGNLAFKEDGTLILYDFGTVIQLPEDAIKTLNKWVNGEGSLTIDELCQLGFERKKIEKISNLHTLLATIFTPFITQGMWHPKSWNLKEGLSSLSEVDLWWFRSAGPPWFLYLMRAFFGVNHVLSALDSTVHIRSCLIKGGVNLHNTEGVHMPGFTIGELPKTSLRVLVTERGEDVVSMSMPARAIENLEILMPETALQAIESAGIELAQIKQRALDSNLTPQELFTASNGERHYRVWIADGF